MADLNIGNKSINQMLYFLDLKMLMMDGFGKCLSDIKNLQNCQNTSNHNIPTSYPLKKVIGLKKTGASLYYKATHQYNSTEDTTS